MRRYSPYNYNARTARRSQSNSPHPDRIEEDRPGGAEVPPREADAEEEEEDGGRKKRGPVSEAVIEHRLALHQVDIGTSGTLAFASTLDHALRCKT